MSEDRLHDLLRLNLVPRWTVIAMRRPQSVAEHSFNVACLCRELAAMAGFGLQDTLALMNMALDHDGGEAWTGDVPANYKAAMHYEDRSAMERASDRLSPWRVEPLSPPFESSAAAEVGRDLLKLADDLEAFLYLRAWGDKEGDPHVVDVTLELMSKVEAGAEKAGINKSTMSGLMGR